MDIDLPVSLTQNDEVAFPVAVYNYLKTPQTVKLDLQQEALVRAARPAGPDPRTSTSSPTRSPPSSSASGPTGSATSR